MEDKVKRVTVSAAVFGVSDVPERVKAAHRVLEALADLNPLYIPDHDRKGLWGAVRPSWEALLDETDGEWLVLFADDAIPCFKLGEDLPMVLAHAPAPIVGFYSSRLSNLYKARKHGSNWILCPGALWGQAIAFERGTLEKFLPWEEKWSPLAKFDRLSDDSRCSVYAILTGCNAAITVPGLVGHDMSMPSLLGHGAHLGGKTPAAFMGKQRPCELSWVSPSPCPKALNNLGSVSTRWLKTLREMEVGDYDLGSKSVG